MNRRPLLYAGSGARRQPLKAFRELVAKIVRPKQHTPAGYGYRGVLFLSFDEANDRVHCRLSAVYPKNRSGSQVAIFGKIITRARPVHSMIVKGITDR